MIVCCIIIMKEHMYSDGKVFVFIEFFFYAFLM